MPFPRPSSPRVLWEDFRAFTRERSKAQKIAALLAVIMPMLIIAGFYHDSTTGILPGEQIIYVQSWNANRSDAEIIAQQKIDQQRKDEAKAERQRQYQRLAKSLGIE